MKVISGDFLRQITFLEEKYMTVGKTLNGRQLAFLVWDKFRRDSSEVGLTEFFDLREVRLMNDDLTLDSDCECGEEDKDGQMLVSSHFSSTLVSI